MFSKSHNHFKSIFVVLFTVLISLTSCDSFLKSVDLKSDLEKAIADANAPTLSLKVDIDDVDVGTVSPSGFKDDLKVNHPLNISANISKKYKFLYWEAVSQKDLNTSMAEYVKIDDKYSADTAVTVLTYSNDIFIKPVYALIPSIIEDSAVLSGVVQEKSWESACSFNFNLPGDKSFDTYSFRFSESEAEEIEKAFSVDGISQVTFFRDSNELVYAYEVYGSRYFKNLTITIDGESICDKFESPEMVSSKLILTPSDNPLDSEDESAVKTVTLEINTPELFYVAGEGIKVFSSSEKYSYSYKISNTTKEKESVSFTVDNNSAGTPSPNVATLYNTNGKAIPISFKESEGYQFIKWTSSTENVVIDDPESASTNIRVLSYSGTGTVITAVTGVRPKISSVSPKTENGSAVERDRSIQITFSKKIDSKSFTYSEEEREEIKNVSTWLGAENSPYGFVRDGVITYKNIQI